MRINTSILLFGLCFIIILGIQGCQSSKKLSQKNIQPYTIEKGLDVKYRIFHQPQSTQLFIKTYATRYQLSLKAFPDFKSKTTLFETSKIITNASYTIETINIPLTRSTFALVIEVLDLQDNSTFSDIVAINRFFTNEQTILIKDEANQPLMTPYVQPSQALQFIPYNDSKSTVYIKYFENNFKAAAPPFARQSVVFNPRKKPVKTYQIKPSEWFTIPQQGLYLIQTDSISKQGFFLICFDEDFPKVTRLSEVAKSLRYITKKAEYEDLTNPNLDTKLELDKFWLSRAGNKDKARVLIQQFYKRIEYANLYFSTYKEGWKTDRGIIYTIFGQPTSIQKSDDSEYWYYRRTAYRDMVNFYFDKKNGQFILRRSPILEQSWRAEIYEWRRGSIW